MQSLTSQFYAFLVTVLAGATIGVLFDFYRVTRGLIRPKKVLTGFGDLIFWVIATVVVFFMLLVGNWGEIRFYVLIGMLTGVGFYLKCLSRYFINTFSFVFLMLKKIIALITKTLSLLWFVITYPFIIVRNIVIIPIGFLGISCARGIRWVRKSLNRFVGLPVKRYISRVKRSLKDRLIKYLQK